MKVYKTRNEMNMTHEYHVKFLVFKKVFVLTDEHIITEEYPLWYKVLTWYIQKKCKHRWEKIGLGTMIGVFLGNGKSKSKQKVKCIFCGKEDSYIYEWGIDTH